MKKNNLIKNYKKLGAKKFFQRWKEGIENLSLISQTKVSIQSQFIIIFGIILGIIFTIMSKTWWLVIILVGSIITCIMTLLGYYQKLFLLRKMEETMKQINSPQIKDISKENIFLPGINSADTNIKDKIKVNQQEVKQNE